MDQLRLIRPAPELSHRPDQAQALYGMYFEELQYCTEAGFDGVMINEHHNNPLCMMPSVNVIGAILARTTRKGRIVFLGNVFPIHDNPLRLAEDLSHRIPPCSPVEGCRSSHGLC